jgi:hypothetical protein
VLGDDASYNKDIYQGYIGDCYYLAALAAIGESSTRIKSAILTQTYNTAGIFAAKVFIKGIPTLVTVDDYLPFTSSSSKLLAFDRYGTDNSLWAPFLEKVWAKVNGNYDRIVGGGELEVFSFILGAPGDYYTISDASGINGSATTAFALLKAADASSFIMGAGTSGSSDATYNSYGLPNDHAYTVIGTYTVTDSTGKSVNLIQCRNPWGNDIAYVGTYKDGSSAWTDSIKAQVPYSSDTSDGIFWITDAEFVLAFSDI